MLRASILLTTTTFRETIKMTFQESIQVCFQKYADFNGRAKKSEYWWFELFLFLGSLILGIVGDILPGIFALATILPSLAVGARRLHDINKSGWFQLIWFIPILGWIYMIYLLVQDGDAAANQYGEPTAN